MVVVHDGLIGFILPITTYILKVLQENSKKGKMGTAYKDRTPPTSKHYWSRQLQGMERVPPKTELEKACLEETGHCFTQACHTPFLTPPFIDLFGKTSLSKAFPTVLDGTFTPLAFCNAYIAKFLKATHRPAFIEDECGPKIGQNVLTQLAMGTWSNRIFCIRDTFWSLYGGDLQPRDCHDKCHTSQHPFAYRVLIWPMEEGSECHDRKNLWQL